MVEWHHQLKGHVFEQAPKDSEGQGSQACYSSWVLKESDMTERLNSKNWCSSKFVKKVDLLLSVLTTR